MFHKKHISAYFLMFYFIIGCIILIIFDGHGLDGDSLRHYSVAKKAPSDIQLYFFHWGKPFFTLVASPFAQFGLKGIKFFNLVIALCTGYYTYLVCNSLNKKYAEAVIVILFSCSLWFSNMFSGLTEYLSALMLISAIYYVQKNKINLAAIIISFTPFVRSEGLMLVAGFAVFFLYHKKIKAVFCLITGHVVYSVIGYFWWHDIFWVFTKIPYAKLSTIYGKGTLIHFVEQLNYMLSTPIYIFFIVGFFLFIYSLFNVKKIKELFFVEVLLVHGIFVGFFVAHTLFWYLAIFGSMGLNRVFITVLPLVAIIVLNGVLFMQEKLQKFKFFLPIIILTFVLFQFSVNPSTLDFEKDFKLEESKVLIKETLEDQKLSYNKVYASDPYVFYLLDDLQPTENGLDLRTEEIDDLLIWDSWYSPLEDKISLRKLKDDNSLKKVFQINNKANEPVYVGFIKVN